MPDKSPEIIGKNWKTEVGTWKAEKEIRNEFYKKAAGLRFEVDADLNEIVKHPETKGLKTQKELTEIPEAKNFKYRVKEGKTERLYNILHKYFKSIGITNTDAREKEVVLSLYCLTQQGLNVDLIVASWKVEVIKGQIYIEKSTAEKVADGLFLRAIPEVTDKGWTPAPPIPGLPAKPQEEKKKTKPKPKPKAKPKSEPKESDILETF